MTDLPRPFDAGPPWAKITPARWGFYVTFGSATLLVTETAFGTEKRWWRPTRAGAERKAQRLIDEVCRRRNSEDRSWYYEPSSLPGWSSREGTRSP